MAYSQYSEHRRPTAVPKVRRTERQDSTGEDELKLRGNFERAVARAGEPERPKGKRSFAEALQKKASKK